MLKINTVFAKCLFIFILIISIAKVNAQDNILSQKITLSANNISTKEILKQIESVAKVKFSYNSEIIDADKIVSLDADNIKLEDCLDQIFQNTISYRVAGNHIILLKNTPEKQAKKHIKKPTYIISGTVTDYQTGEYLKNVSVYDVNDQYFCLTDTVGYYNLTISETANFRGLNYGKIGYFDTIIVINAKPNPTYNINLQKIPISIIDTVDIKVKQIFLTQPVAEERIIAKTFIPQQTVIHARNLNHIKINKFIHVSILPKVGTNLSADGLAYNYVSINVLAWQNKWFTNCRIQ